MVEAGWGAGGPGDRMLWRSTRFASSWFAYVPGRVDDDKKDSWVSSRARGLKNRNRLIYIFGGTLLFKYTVTLVEFYGMFPILCQMDTFRLHEKHFVPESVNFAVTFLKYKLFRYNLIMNCFR